MIAEERLEVRIHGDAHLPALIYLPGLHGDWTLIGGFRRAVAGRVRFVEFTYPRTLEWSLADYAGAIETELAANAIEKGWLLAESFGSQIAWEMLARGKFAARGLILAGGFVKHPMRWGVVLAGRIGGGISLRLLTRLLFGYAKFARYRFRRSPETLAGIQEFIVRRTELDRRAVIHRLGLIASYNPRFTAHQTSAPVYALSGFFDPVVPWLWVRRWLRRNCPGLRDYRVIVRGDHNVLGSAADAAATQILNWINNRGASPGRS